MALTVHQELISEPYAHAVIGLGLIISLTGITFPHIWTGERV